MQTVLVTGGAGFIGSHVVPRLVQSGHRVRVLDSLSPQVHGAIPRELDWLEQEGIEFIRGSVTRRADIQRALVGVNQVVHLAAETGTGQSMYEVSHYNEVNTLGTAHLFDVLANTLDRTVHRVVLASSRSVYGEGAYTCEACAPTVRVYPSARSRQQLEAQIWEPLCERCGSALTVLTTREDDRVRPASVYAATKYAQEDLVRVGAESLNMGYAILRLQNVYGEGQSLKNPYTGILSIFSTRIRRGLELPVFEDGQETRDFVHVEDVARAFQTCVDATTAPDGVVNVGSGRGTKVLDMARQLSRAMGIEPQVRVTAEFRVGDIRHNVADIARLQERLHCVPGVTLADGLRRFAEWTLSQPLPDDQLGRANAELQARNLMK